jgi:hypothetical protein
MDADDIAMGLEPSGFDQSWSTVQTAYPDGYYGRVDRHRTQKRIASGVSTAASLGISGAQLGTGVSSIGVATALVTGVAVSATGVGLVATAAALTLGSMYTNAASFGSTLGHRNRLQAIKKAYDSGQYNRCECLVDGSKMARDHDWIGTKILPYIINQKTEKAAKKGIGTFALGSLVTAYSIGRSAYKSITSTKGVKRNFYAHVLARHLITHECSLVEHIVCELLSSQEMAVLKGQNSDTAGAALKDKMKSV